MTRRDDRRSAEAQAYRAIYRTRRWKALRLEILARDLWRCRRCGVTLKSGRSDPRAAVVNHIKPHKGDPVLAFDPNNCEACCKQCHDGPIQSGEARGYSGEIGEDGWPSDPKHPANQGPVKIGGGGGRQTLGPCGGNRRHYPQHKTPQVIRKPRG